MSIRRIALRLALPALALAAGAGLLAQHCSCNHGLRADARRGCVHAWFKHEFGASDAAVAAILREQESFRVACAGHCHDIAEARARLDALPASASEAERAGLVDAVRRAEAFCTDERRAYAHRIAALLPESTRHRYLELVLPRLAALDHRGAPDATGHR